jgi:hypothetical protein
VVLESYALMIQRSFDILLESNTEVIQRVLYGGGSSTVAARRNIPDLAKGLLGLVPAVSCVC